MIILQKKKAINQRFWHDGRLQRPVNHKKISHYPDTTIVGCVPQADGTMQVIFATCYRPDVQNISFLAAGNILNKMDINNGLPALNDTLESNIPSLYFTGIHGVNDFGPFLFLSLDLPQPQRLSSIVLRIQVAKSQG